MSATARNGRSPRVPLITPVPAAIEPPATPTTSTPSLDAAVLRVQANAGKLMRNANGQVGPRVYRYVTLAGVVDEVLPLLVAEELLWRTFPTVLDDGRAGLRYRMVHIPSGEADEDTMALPCDPTMQALGSAITYGRRYALVAYLQLTVDEDDDGRSANTPRAQSQPNGAQSSAQSSAQSQQPQAKPPADGQGTTPASVKQRQMIRTRAGVAGLSSSQLADVILRATGNEPRGMDAEVATRWLHMGLERLPARAVDAVLDGIANGGAQS